MKNKPTRHKDLNTFKFQPFSERINCIDVDIFHRVGHEYETQNEEQSYFYQTVEKWSALNLTQGFKDFKKEIRHNDLVTLPQVIFRKDAIVDVLFEHIKKKNALYLQPLLEITVSLVQDLRKEFYPYYKTFLETLINLLETKDTEQLEWTFHCLAYIFKFLWRPLIKDIGTVSKALLPLLSDTKPLYINNFAAESFAFVARKVKDYKSFLLVLLKSVKQRKDGVRGIGKLLFEVIYGVGGQFHSCADNVLPFLIHALCDDKFPQEILFEVLEQVIANAVVKIKPDKSSLLWSSLLTELNNQIQSWKSQKTEDVSNNIELVLKLLGQTIEYHHGRLLQDPVPILNKIQEIFSQDEFPKSLLIMTSQICILLLLSKNIKLFQDQAAMITQKVLSVSDDSVVLYFIENISGYSSFDTLILPTFLRYCIKNNFSRDWFKILTKLILIKSPLCGSGITLPTWSRYRIPYNVEFNSTIEKFLLDILKIENIELLDNPADYLSALICLPHISLSEKDNFIETVNKNIIRLLNVIDDYGSEEKSSSLKKYLFILNSTVECLIHCEGNAVLLKMSDMCINTLLKYADNENFVTSLKTLDLIVTALRNEDEIIKFETVQKLNKTLERNFSAPFHEIRLLTSHIYTHFERLPEFILNYSSNPEITPEGWKVFSICYTVESIDPQVQTYRDQLQNLEKLCFDKPQMLMCNQTEFNLIPLRFLCGCLFINFKLLWEPIMKIIESHAHGMLPGDFWGVFGKQLHSANSYVEVPVEIKSEDIDCDFDFICDYCQQLQKFNSKPDFFNYRLLLWKAMIHFADIAEAKTRDVAEHLLNFIEKEYKKLHSSTITTMNIKQNDLNSTQLEENEADKTFTSIDSEENNLPKDPEVEAVTEDNSLREIGRKKYTTTLVAYLSVFSKFISPKSMYKEKELYDLYYDLLSHKYSEVQKAALKCILTYKHKSLVPYQENLLNLIDDKNFKTELVKFRVDQESVTVKAEDREYLIPIVMRIVYSKMTAKIGLRTGGKSAGQKRRKLVFRFLAGCKEEEMNQFLQMAFKVFDKYLIIEDLESMVTNIVENVDLESFIPPKRLQSAVNLIDVVLENFGGLMGNELLDYLIKILLVVGANIKAAVIHSNEVHSGYLPVLRKARTSVITTVETFFIRFDKYPWRADQINSIFKVFVWPYLDKLTREGIHSPTTLLKLFVQWGSNPRYFPLLMKHEESNRDQYILPHIMKLLLNPKSHISVINIIQDLIEKLLNLEPDEEEVQITIPIDNLLPIEAHILERIQVNDKLNYGSSILLPHVPLILERIRIKLTGKAKSLNQKELFILSRISELVWESKTSDTVLQLLLPIAAKKLSIHIEEDTALQFLTSIKNLLHNVEEPEKHLRNIAPLFSDVTYVSGKKVLMEILSDIACKSKNANLTRAHQLIVELYAWIRGEQPDFDRRHAAFKLIRDEIEGGVSDIDFAILIIYNCYFFLKNEKDLSPRENSIYCLKHLCASLLKSHEGHHENISFILDKTIFPLIQKGMRSKDDFFKNDCISLLGFLAMECPNSHYILRDLNIYTDKNDPYIDFFENMAHCQMRQHASALIRFCHVTKKLSKSVNVRTLTQFILPLATNHLCSERYAGKKNLVDASIETLHVVSRLLPWHQYEGLLKFYLMKLRSRTEYQKQLVRIIVAILDSFHFDLSKGYVTKPSIYEEEILPQDENQDNVEKNAKAEKSEEGEEEISAYNKENEETDLQDDDNYTPIIDEDDNEEDNDEATPVEEDVLTEKPEKCLEKIVVLCKSTATRVIKAIQVVLLPSLHKVMGQMTIHETSHKVNRRKISHEQEDEDLLRVPLSLAVVKLLQRLPKELLDFNLPGVFMKLCTFLKSRLESVRRITRETLQQIMLSLGPEYLNIFLAEVTPLLKRGFEVHVLVFTVHGVLSCLKEAYKPTHIDSILLTVSQLCMEDLFGCLSEEKDIDKIGAKTSEAKSTKSLDLFQILARFITEKCLLDLVIPLKNVLKNTHSYKVVKKVQEALRCISIGLVENEFIVTESLIKFSYGIASESIPDLVEKEKPRLTEKEREKLEREQPDCFIIPKPTVNRSGIRSTPVKLSFKTNSHVLVEFGLRICFVLLKKEKLKDIHYTSFLDPFVVIFKKCLKAPQVKLNTLTLQCLSWIMKYELPSLKNHIKDIAASMFSILHKYASAGLSKGDNFDLVVATFKAVAVLIRDVKCYQVSINHLKILLHYVEQDMHDYDRQAIAFNLLRAIISRKLIIPEIAEVMDKVAELSIISELVHVRTQARSVFHQYLMEYPVGKNLHRHISFYMSQLDYEMRHGRESAIEMIQTMINSFPQKVLREYDGTFFINLGARLVNDEEPECRKMVGKCLIDLLTKLEKSNRDTLFDIILMWFADKNIAHRRLAAQLCGIFVTAEKALFETRLQQLLPLVMRQFGIENSPGRFVKRSNDEEVTEEEVRIKDHHLYQVLQMLLKLSALCPSFLKNTEDIEVLAGHIQNHLSYPHEWVRLAAAQFLGFVLSTIDPEKLAKLIVSKESLPSGYLYSNPLDSVKALTLDLCDQLQPEGIKNDFAEQIIKNLVFIARVLQGIPLSDTFDNHKFNLLWLTKRMRKIVNTEIVESPKSTVLRTEVFKWVAAVGTTLDIECIKNVLHHLLAPVVREMLAEEEQLSDLKKLAKEVGNLLKKRVGMELYTDMLTRLQQTLSTKRAERKRFRTQLAVTDPEEHAKKKIRTHEKKKEAKKRKLSEIRGKPRKKRKNSDMDSVDIV